MNRKKFVIVCSLVMLATVAFSQRTVRRLTFTGADNGIFAKTDSVRVRNLDRLCDTTVKWPDSLFSFALSPCWGPGIDELSGDAQALQVFPNIPNPAGTDTKITVFQPGPGMLNISVTLTTGAQVAGLQQELGRGYYSFLFSPGHTGIFIFTAHGHAGMKSIKIISDAPDVAKANRLAFLGTINAPPALKSARAHNNFVWDTCNNLEFTGYHGTLSATILTPCPGADTTLSFDFTHTAHSCAVTSVRYGKHGYHTVAIGTQCWFRENLNIGTKLDTSQIASDNGIIEKYCYDDQENNCEVYGALYPWNEMMKYTTTPGARGICPPGWHVPTNTEMATMLGFLGPDSIAGGKLKEAHYDHWLSPNAGADNSSGFTALAAGMRDNGISAQLWKYTSFWSSYSMDMNNGWSIALSYFTAGVGSGFALKTTELSVRCIHD
ncbi:MAG: fibrobacter succinogenes major paralogous domain-containing protein [Bacteroidota bacterium]